MGGGAPVMARGTAGGAGLSQPRPAMLDGVDDVDHPRTISTAATTWLVQSAQAAS